MGDIKEQRTNTKVVDIMKALEVISDSIKLKI